MTAHPHEPSEREVEEALDDRTYYAIVNAVTSRMGYDRKLVDGAGMRREITTALQARLRESEHERRQERISAHNWRSTASDEAARAEALEQERDRLRAALLAIAEGGLGDAPWLANYKRILIR